MLQIGAEQSRVPSHAELTRLIYSGLLRLDAKDFRGWLDLCSIDFTYTIRAWSPEIRRDMTWLAHDRNGIATLVQQLPRHNSDASTFTRSATIYTIDVDDASATADIVSVVTIYRTELDGGTTSLFALGHYHDRAVQSEGRWLLRSRELRLQTRSLGIGTHYVL